MKDSRDEVRDLFLRRLMSRVGIALFVCLSIVAFENVRSGWLGPVNKFEPPSSVLAQPVRPVVPPQVLYYKAWKLIKESYYDQKFNNQDWSRWEHRYDGKLKSADEAYKAIETMLASLGDPYTRFLNKEAFDEEKSQIEAHLFGVGMQLGMNNKEHKVVVIAPIEDTPAFKAGIMPGDEIFEIDNKSVKGQSLDQVVKQIRGPINTKVSITVLRNGDRKKFALTRAEIPIRAIANETILPDNIGYIRLDSFISAKANDEMRSALRRMANSKGIILDLRNNPGGLLSNAVEIANMFLDRGIIVSTIDSDGYKTSTISGRNPLSRQPLVVLINKSSASASEILSGALRDNGRAKLVGVTTFGKGLVQAINRLEDGSGINVTIAKYLTPNETDIHKVGIVPDYEVQVKDDDFNAGKGPWWIDPTMTNFSKRSPSDGKDAQLMKAIDVLKKEIIAHQLPAGERAATAATGAPSAPTGSGRSSN